LLNLSPFPVDKLDFVGNAIQGPYYQPENKPNDPNSYGYEY